MSRASVGRRSITYAAAAVIAVVAFLAVFGPWVSPSDPDVGQIGDALADPSAEHWLGTDYLGRDVVSRLIAGARVSAFAGLEATAVALVLGVGVGMAVGLAGGWVDRVAMRLIEGVSAIPALVLAIAIIAALGSGLTRSMFAVGIAFAMAMARLARGLTLAERERIYVDGARVAGAGRWRLLRRHIAPNITGPIAVQATLVFAQAITIEAGLSFLGLGTQPPDASWGSMLSTAQRTIREAPFQAIPPGVALVVTVLAINVLGDAVVRRRRGQSYDNPTGYLEPIPVTARARTDASPGDEEVTEEAPAGVAGPGEPGAGALLHARGVTVRYGDTVAVRGAGLSVAPGEVVALVGESGSGKTSLAMALAGLATPPATAEGETIALRLPGGTLDLVGADAAARARWRADVGVVFQEPAASLNPLQTVGRQLRDVIRAQRAHDASRTAGGSAGSIDGRIVELLTAVGLPRPAEVAGLRPGQISGGMAQRVMIALALAKSPALLIADEPTTALDVTVQAEIIRLLRRLCEERHFGVLLVTHDLGVASELADRCVVMFRGRVVEAGPTRELVVRPRHPYTSALVSAVAQNEPGRPILVPPADDRDGSDASPPVSAGADTNDGAGADAEGCPYRSRCPHEVARCREVMPLRAPVGPPAASASPHVVACHRTAELELTGAHQIDGAQKVGDAHEVDAEVAR